MNKKERVEKLAENIKNCADCRPNTGRFVDIKALKRKVVALLLDGDLKEEFHFAGWSLGDAIGARTEKISVKEALERVLLELEEEKFGKTELVDENAKEILFRIKESANCAGLGSIGMKLCFFEAGYITGIVSAMSGKKVVCEEKSCIGEGNADCEFTLRIS